MVAEDHVHHPVQGILDGPVIAHDGPISLAGGVSEVMKMRVSVSIQSFRSRLLLTTPLRSGQP